MKKLSSCFSVCRQEHAESRPVCKMNDNTHIMASRITWVDTLKGIAIILVVIVHNTDESVSDFLFCFIMPLFFLLSGFLFSPKPVKAYFHKSTKRLIVPYTAYLISIALPYIILMAINGELFETKGKSLLINMLYGGESLKGSFGVFWFVSVLWFATNLFNWMLNVANRDISIWWGPLLILAGISAELIPCPLPWNLHVVPMAAAYIWTGYWIHRSISRFTGIYRAKDKIYYVSISAAIMLCVFIFRHELTLNMKYNNYGIPGISFMSSVAASLCMACFAILLSDNQLIGKILGFIGKASMTIMYLHQPIKFMLLNYLGLQDNHFIAVIFGILLSLAAYWLLKQTDVTRKIFLADKVRNGLQSRR